MFAIYPEVALFVYFQQMILNQLLKSAPCPVLLFSCMGINVIFVEYSGKLKNVSITFGNNVIQVK